MIERKLQSELLRLGKDFQVVVVTGPRQSGKTTLCKMSFPNYLYVNLEHPDTREQLIADPATFLNYKGEGMIVDEAQRWPDIFSYIQVLADENRSLHYIITGSNNFALMEKITQSLAGRAALLTLLPLAIAELQTPATSDELMLNGFYPAVWGDGKRPADVYANYYRTYIERDLHQLINIKDLDLFRQYVRLMAGRVGNEFNATHISNDLGIDVKTVQHWLSILKTSYIAFTLPPYYRNVGKRIIKAHKLYFYDTGLVCHLLGIEEPPQLSAHPLRGAIFENMVVAEFLKTRFNSGKNPNFFFYRDQPQNDVDLIEEVRFEQLNAYEIKSSKRYTPQFFKGLEYFSRIYSNYVKDLHILYDGDETIATTNGSCVNWKEYISNL